MHIKIVDYNNLDVVKNKALHCIVDRVYFNYIKERNRYPSESIDLNSGLNIDTELGIVYTSYPIDIFELVNEIFLFAPEIKIFAIFELTSEYYDFDGDFRRDLYLFFGMFHKNKCSKFILDRNFNKFLIPKLIEYFYYLTDESISENHIPSRFNKFEEISHVLKNIDGLFYSSMPRITNLENLVYNNLSGYWKFSEDYQYIMDSIKIMKWIYPYYYLEQGVAFKNSDVFSTNYSRELISFKDLEDRRINNNKYTIVIDTETNGLPKNYNEEYPFFGFPDPVQISWIVFDEDNNLVEFRDYIIKQQIPIPKESTLIHGITNEITNKKGADIYFVLEELIDSLWHCQEIVGHNLDFDIKVLERACYFAFYHAGPSLVNGFMSTINLRSYCTMKESMKHLNKANLYKYPKLSELYEFIFEKSAIGLHNSSWDIYYTHEIYTWLKAKELEEMT